MRPLTALLATCGLCLLAAPAAADEHAREWMRKHQDEIVGLYRHFHSHPELSFEEQETAARLASELKGAGVEVTTGVGGHGVVGLLKNGAGPTLMLRTDLDALPVVEETRLAYASTKKVKDRSGKEVGVMHACGHDVHITNQVAVARYLASHKDRWQGTVMFVGQPAEELGNGAKIMLEDGLFKRFPKPDFALALHCDPQLATGKVAYKAGYALANVDSVDVVVRGRGGHGAYPHTTIDPIVIAAHVVVDLQSIIARELKPGDPAVITVGSIHGGTKHNIIGNECHLQLTVRSYTPEVRKHLLAAIERKAKAAAQSAGAPEPTVTVSDGTPAMFNDEKLVARVTAVFERTLGKENVIPAEAQMGGEDFSYYGLAGVPIFMYRLGTINPQRHAAFTQRKQELPSLHSSQYYPDAEQALPIGLETMAAAVQELLPVKK